MKEKDIHELIEQEEAELKERIWKRISSQLFENTPQPSSNQKDIASNDGKASNAKQDNVD